MKHCTTIEEALAAVAQHSGPPEDFELPVAHSFLDKLGTNMAIVTDAILQRDWLPDGFEDRTDHRTYCYRAID